MTKERLRFLLSKTKKLKLNFLKKIKFKQNVIFLTITEEIAWKTGFLNLTCFKLSPVVCSHSLSLSLSLSLSVTVTVT